MNRVATAAGRHIDESLRQKLYDKKLEIIRHRGLSTATLATTMAQRAEEKEMGRRKTPSSFISCRLRVSVHHSEPFIPVAREQM